MKLIPEDFAFLRQKDYAENLTSILKIRLKIGFALESHALNWLQIIKQVKMKLLL